MDLDSVLDLTDKSIIQILGTNTTELTGEWRYTQIFSIAVTQKLGRAAFESNRIKAIKYHSAKDPGQGKCLAIFIDRLVKGEDLIE